MITIPEKFDPLAPYANPAAFGLHVYDKLPAAHHERWLDLALDENIRQLLIVAPRGSAKTRTFVETLLPWYIGTYPLRTNFIGSIADDQTKVRLGAVQSIIESSAGWQDAFPDVVPDKQRGWSANGLFVKRTDVPYQKWLEQVAKQGNPKDANLIASGSGGRGIIGARISGLCIIDDPHDEKSVTLTQRERVWTWLMLTVMPTLTDTGRMIIITTRWHRDDVAGRIMERHGDTWTVDVTRAVQNGKSYWPSFWPMKRLNAERRRMGARFFRAAYLNDPQGLAGDFFANEYFQGLPAPLPKLQRVVLGVDLAISQKETADFSCIAACGLDEENNTYILHVERGRWTFDQTLRRCESVALSIEARYGRLDMVGIESVGYQAAAVQMLLRDTLLPVVPITVTKDKATRAEAWRIRGEQERLFIDRGAAWFSTFIDEALDFPQGEHDDQVDAVSIAWAALSAKRGLTMV